ncbi:MAG TPA: ZIP family metal transporter [Gemmatimonadales bacterium]|nr:ZIP family metal transporter [Gemmatimonadales bacterium]
MGIAFVVAAHGAAGTHDLELNRLEAASPVYGYQVMLVNTLHAAPEGIAIGAAMAVDVPFGVFLALAIGAHNVPEGAVLAAILTSRGLDWGRAAGVAVAANLSQILLAVTTFAVVVESPALLPWALGTAAGALVYLVLSDLLPESYRQAGRTSIALVTVLAMAVLVLLGRELPRP